MRWGQHSKHCIKFMKNQVIITVFTKSGKFEHPQEYRSYAANSVYQCMDDIYYDFEIALKYGVSAFDIAERTEILIENTGDAFRYDPLAWQRIEKMNLDPSLPLLPIMKKVFQPALFLSNTVEHPQEEQRPRRLKGFTFAITGTLSIKRKSAVAYILANGGDYLPRVTKNVDFLIIGDDAGDTKTELCDRYGISEISEEELKNMAEGKAA